MIYFIVVELIDATPEEQGQLDGLMEISGFSKTTRSKNEKSYRLPRGVYRSTCRQHAGEVLGIARSIVNSTGRANEVMLIESAGARWYANADAEKEGQAETAAAD